MIIKLQPFIEDSSLSGAWARAFLQIMEPGIAEITPLVVSITGLSAGGLKEDPQVRRLLDNHLEAAGRYSVHTVANTIFPAAYWNPSAGRAKLFECYLKNLPRIKEADKRHNGHGLYFERMVAFGPERINQLEHVIETYTERGNHRRSALQAAIFDPAKDHVHSKRLGFPCLQQVAFAPSGPKKDKLTVTGFYATQHLFEKAYGNFLGLHNLGRFMAHEMGLELERVNCIASVAKRGHGPKKSHEGLVAALTSLMEETPQHEIFERVA